MIGYQSFLHFVFDLSSGCKCFIYGKDLTGVINGHRLRAQYAQLRSRFKKGFNFTCQKPGSVHRQAVSGGKQIQKSAMQKQSNVSRDTKKTQVYMQFIGLYTCTLTANKITRQR